MDELHEHGGIQPGIYSAGYPGMPDESQGTTAGDKTYIVGDSNQLGPVPPEVYVAMTRGREAMEQTLEEEHEFHFTDAISDGLIDQADRQADDGMGR